MWWLLVVLFGLPLVSTSSCPLGYALEPNTNKCYKVYSSPTTYFSAQYTCTEDGGNLASITNAYENSFIGNLIPFGVSYFIGLTKLVNPTQYTWLDETPYSYSNFYPGQNYNESCVTYMGSYNAWFVTPCSRTLGFICSTTTTSSCPTCPVCNGTCAARCESGWAYFDQSHSCYRTFRMGSWWTAEDICQGAGGHLTSIHSVAENNFVIELARTGYTGSDSQQPWIGLQRQFDGSLTWTDESQVNYTNWYPGRPYDSPYDCTVLYAETSSTTYQTKWDSFHCYDKQRAFVCKKPAY